MQNDSKGNDFLACGEPPHIDPSPFSIHRFR